MINKKVLLVGDFRDCLNFGAVGTTEQLIKMLQTVVPEENLKYIEYRSFTNKTPVCGWDDSAVEHRNALLKEQGIKQKIVRTICKVLLSLDLLDMAFAINAERKKRRIRRSKSRSRIILQVPYLYRDYPEYVQKVLRGDELQYEAQLLDWADVVLVNAEGSIVKGTSECGIHREGALYSLFISYLAKEVYKKDCYIINHTVDPQNEDVVEIIKKVYPLLDGIYVRESMSQRELEKYGIFNTKYVPDALFAYEPDKDWKPSEVIKKKIDFSKPYICLGDSSGLGAVGISVRWDIKIYYVELIEKLKKICPQIIFIDGFNEWNNDINYVVSKTEIVRLSMRDIDYQDLYQIFHRSRLFLSGRWHTSILAQLAGTPIVLWGADSHKTQALYEMLSIEGRCWDIDTFPIHIDDIVKNAKELMDNNICNDEKVQKLGREAWKNIEMIRDRG